MELCHCANSVLGLVAIQIAQNVTNAQNNEVIKNPPMMLLEENLK